jgi:hypothetical protein
MDEPAINPSNQPRLAPKVLTLMFVGTIAGMVAILATLTVVLGRAHDKPLPVAVSPEDRMIAATIGGQKAQLMRPVIVVKNLSNESIPNLAIDINGQYFMYQNKPLEAGEELVILQEQFTTKSGQVWVPGRWAIKKVNVYGQLPSRARGIHVWEADTTKQST